MRIYGARIFSKFFGGKIKIFDTGYPKVKLDNRDKFQKTFNKQNKLIQNKTNLTEYA